MRRVIAPSVLLAVILATAAWWSLDHAQQLKVGHLALSQDSGVILETGYTSWRPARVTGTSLDDDLVADDPSGYLWDNTVLIPTSASSLSRSDGGSHTEAVSTPGLATIIDPLVLEGEQYQGLMVVSSTHACRLPRDHTSFTVDYADGTVDTVKGPTPTQNM